MGTMIRNYWTTFFGILGAVANQASGPGFKVPTTAGEWAQTLLSFVIAAFGIVAKDASTGSAPK